MFLRWSPQSLVSYSISVELVYIFSKEHLNCHQLTCLCNAGPRSSNLNQNVLTKLKAVYTLVEQLYTGSQRALAVVALSNEVPTHLADVLRRLAVLPQRFQELPEL